MFKNEQYYKAVKLFPGQVDVEVSVGTWEGGARLAGDALDKFGDIPQDEGNDNLNDKGRTEDDGIVCQDCLLQVHACGMGLVCRKVRLVEGQLGQLIGLKFKFEFKEIFDRLMPNQLVGIFYLQIRL